MRSSWVRTQELGRRVQGLWKTKMGPCTVDTPAGRKRYIKWWIRQRKQSGVSVFEANRKIREHWGDITFIAERYRSGKGVFSPVLHCSLDGKIARKKSRIWIRGSRRRFFFFLISQARDRGGTERTVPTGFRGSLSIALQSKGGGI